MAKFNVNQFVIIESEFVAKVIVNEPDIKGRIIVQPYTGEYVDTYEGDCYPLTKKELAIAEVITRCRDQKYTDAGLIQELAKL